MISVVVPVYNEEYTLLKNEHHFRRISKIAELIFVDGGSSDQTVKFALSYARVISCKKGRALQMNVGARKTNHNIILFLHADTHLDPESLVIIESTVEQEGCIGGCFRQVYETSSFLFKWIAWTGNLRARMLKIFYGDQGIFVRKDIFWQLGGFPETQICEDVLFTRNLRKWGKVSALRQPIHCSARRWVQQGLLKTFLLNMRIRSALLLGQDLKNLSFAYTDIR